MRTPFVFGRIATGENFTDRVEETNRLVDNFKSLMNTIIISPRRWGKSSLVHKASEIAMKEKKNLRICHIDLFNVRDEAHFYSLFAQGVLSGTSSKLDEIVSTARNFLSKAIPKIVFGSDPGQEFTLEFDWKSSGQDADEILDLPEKIAKDKGIEIVICIDEFQNIASFADPLYFQKKLRSHWQLHQNVSYCFFGSKRHMMTEVFTEYSMPFYNFGNVMFLDKIKSEYLTEFIERRFKETGKEIETAASNLLVQLVDCHPYYTQQLAQLSWLRTENTCTVETVKDAHLSLVEQMSLLFDTMTEPLTNQQINFMKALFFADGGITTTKTLSRFGLTSPTSALRAKKALIEKDILDDRQRQLSFQDPVYSWWLRNIYFR